MDTYGVVTVKGVFPFLKREEQFIVDVNSSYEDLVSSFCEELDEDHSAIVLSLLDNNGWNIYIRNEIDDELFSVINDIYPNASLSTCALAAIQDDDCVVLSRVTDVVRPRRLLPCLLQEILMYQVLTLLPILDDDQLHNVVTEQIKALEGSFMENSSPGLSRGFCGYRNLRSGLMDGDDGNSYYRSVYFSLFEQIIIHNRHQLFGQLHDLFRTHGYKKEAEGKDTDNGSEEESEFDEDFEEFLATLKCAADRSIWRTCEELEHDVLCSDSCLDIACVQAIRHLASNFIRVHANCRTKAPGDVEFLEFSGSTLRERLTRRHGGIMSLDEFRKLAVEDMGVDVDAGVLEMGVVLSALQCSGSLVLVEDFNLPATGTAGSGHTTEDLMYKISSFEIPHYAASSQGAWQKGPSHVLFGHVSVARRTSEAEDISKSFSGVGAQPRVKKEQHVWDYALAADQGNAHAAFMLAQRYDAGDGVAESKVDAAKYYKIAADQGNPDAQFMLGMLFDIGDGIPQSESEALRYYKMSASRGNVNAQKVLGEFEDGTSSVVDASYLRERNGCFTYSVLYPAQFFNKNYLDTRRTLTQPPALLEPLSAAEFSRWAKRVKTRTDPHLEHTSPVAGGGWEAVRASVMSPPRKDGWSTIARAILAPTTWSTTSPLKRALGPSLMSPAALPAPMPMPVAPLPAMPATGTESSNIDSDRDSSSLLSDSVDDDLHRAATFLQARVRGSSARKTHLEQKEEAAVNKKVAERHHAAALIQARVRGIDARKTQQEKEELARRRELEKLEKFHRLRKAHQAEEAAMKKIKSFRAEDERDTPGRDSPVRALVTPSSKKSSPVLLFVPPNVVNTQQEAWEIAMDRKQSEAKGSDSSLMSRAEMRAFFPDDFDDFDRGAKPPTKNKPPRTFFPDSSDDDGDGDGNRALAKWEKESGFSSVASRHSAKKSTPSRAFFPDELDEKEQEPTVVAGKSTAIEQAEVGQSTAIVTVADDSSVSSIATEKGEDKGNGGMSGFARALSRGVSARINLNSLNKQESFQLTTAKSFFNSLVQVKKVGAKKKSKTDLLLEEIRMVDEPDSDWDSDSSYSSFDVDEPIWDDEFYEPNEFEKVFILISRICRNLVNKKLFSNFILLNIFAAVVVMGYQSYPQYENDPSLHILDVIIFTIFTIEVIFKVLAEEFRPWLYFTRPETRAWNWFDFIIVVSGMPIPGSTNLKFLRIARLLRLTKVFKKFPQLNMIVLGIVESTSFLVYIVALWFMMQYMYAVLGIIMFSQNDPWHFRTLEYALFTLLQMTTLDFWGEVMLINVYGCQEYASVYYTSDPALGSNVIGDLMYCEHPEANPMLASAYFVSYITISAFCIVPFFIAAMFISMADCVERMKIESKLSHRKHCLLKLKYEEENISNLSLLDSRTKLDIQLTRLAFGGKEITNEIGLNPLEYPGYYAPWYISLLEKYNELALWCLDFSETKRFRRIVTGAILLAGVMLGIETVPSSVEYAHSLFIIEVTVQTVFSLEVVLKVIAEGDCPYMYFSSAWNIFDFVVVAGSFIQSNNQILLLRLLRLFRVFKLAKELKQLQVIMKGATRGLAAAGYIMFIIYITIFVFAIVGNALFSSNDPSSWGQLHIAMIVLTQMILHDAWVDYASTIMFGCDLQPSPLQFKDSECSNPHAQFALGYFFVLLFTVYGSYILMALFVGSIHVAMEEEQYNQCEEDIVQDAVAHISRKRRLKKMAVVRFHQVFKLLDVTESDRIGKEELLFGLKVAKEDNLTPEDLDFLFELIDKDDSGELDFSEFILFMLDLRNLQLRQKDEKEEAINNGEISPTSPTAGGNRRKSTISMSIDIVKSRLEKGSSMHDIHKRGSISGHVSPTLESQSSTWKAKLKNGVGTSSKSGKHASSDEFLDSLISPSEIAKHHKRNKWGKKQTMQHTDSVANIMADIDKELGKVDPQHKQNEPLAPKKELKMNAWGTSKDLKIVTEEDEEHPGMFSGVIGAAGSVGGTIMRRATMNMLVTDHAADSDTHSAGGRNSDSHSEAASPRAGHHHSHHHHSEAASPRAGHHHSHHHHHDSSDGENKHHHHHHSSDGEHKHHHHHHDSSDGEHKHHHHHDSANVSPSSPVRKTASAPASSFFGGRPATGGKPPPAPSRTASENSTSSSSKC